MLESGRVSLVFLNLIGQVDREASEDLEDLFGRAHQAFRSKKLARTESRLRWLLYRWVRMIRVEVSEWRSTLLLRGLFVEELGWSQLAFLLKLSEARVRSLSLDALLDEVSPDDLMNRPTRDCARNDLYLLDVLTRQAWSDRLGIYSPSHFEQHLGECARCRRVFERTQKYQIALKATRVEELPASLQWQNASVSDQASTPRWGSRFPLPIRFLGALGVGVVIFVGVVSAPYLGTFLKTQKAPLQVAEPTQGRAPPVTGEPLLPGLVAQMPPTNPEVEDLRSALAGASSVEPLDEESGMFARIPERILRFISDKKQDLIAKSPVVEKPQELKTPAAPVAPVPNTPVVKTTPSVATAKAAQSASTSTGTSKIFFRWGARAEDPDRVTQKVLAWLKELGAVNAGELEFGALYRGGRYFHFTIPKAAYSELLNNIKTLPLTDFTDAAAEGSRVIAGDESRIVFWIGPAGSR